MLPDLPADPNAPDEPLDAAAELLYDLFSRARVSEEAAPRFASRIVDYLKQAWQADMASRLAEHESAKAPAGDKAIGVTTNSELYTHKYWIDRAWKAERDARISLRQQRELADEMQRLTARAEAAEAKLVEINIPELRDFVVAVEREAQHQRLRWGSQHDAGKTYADWFWLIGYLAGKALHAAASGDRDKTLHHIITTAAACANWHASILGQTDMRPGLSQDMQEKIDTGSPGTSEYKYFLDTRPYTTQHQFLSGATIKKNAGRGHGISTAIPDAYQLFLEEEGDKPDKPIADSINVDLSGRIKRFYAVPPTTFASPGTSE